MSEKGASTIKNISSASVLGISECVAEDNAPTIAEKETSSTIENYDCENIPVNDGGSLPSRTKWDTILLMSALSLANLLVALDTTIVTTALPIISQDFQSSAGYAWIGSAYILATAVTAPVWAKISDIWGRKPILLISISSFFIGSLLCGVSVNMTMLIVSRTVQGVGGGGLGVLVTICISDTFSMRERPAYFGIIGMTWAFASAIGPLLGGVLTEKASWKWCFYINLPCVALCFLVVLSKLKVHSPKTPVWEGLKAVDWLGSIFMITGTILLLYGLQVGGVEQPWTSAMVLSFMIIGVFLGIIFVLVEWKVAKYPLMPLRIFSHSGIVAALGVACFHSMTLIGGAYFLPLYFQGVLGASPLQSGIYLIPLTVSLSLVNCGVGFWVRRTGKYILAMRISTLLMALGFGLFIDLPDKYEWAKLIIYQLIAGAGLGPNFQCPLIAMQAATPQADHAVASSAFNFFRNLASSITIVISTSIFQNQMQRQHDELVADLGSKVADLLTGVNAAANVGIINELADVPRNVARHAFLKGMLGMWIMYVVLAGLAFLCSLFVVVKVLSKELETTETGLKAEENKRILEKQTRDGMQVTASDDAR